MTLNEHSNLKNWRQVPEMVFPLLVKIIGIVEKRELKQIVQAIVIAGLREFWT